MNTNATTASQSASVIQLAEAPAPGNIAASERRLAKSANDTDRSARTAVSSVDALALAMRESALGG